MVFKFIRKLFPTHAGSLEEFIGIIEQESKGTVSLYSKQFLQDRFQFQSGEVRATHYAALYYKARTPNKRVKFEEVCFKKSGSYILEGGEASPMSRDIQTAIRRFALTAEYRYSLLKERLPPQFTVELYYGTEYKDILRRAKNDKLQPFLT